MGNSAWDRVSHQQYSVDEALYCEAPHAPDDVICSGSEDDYYETPRDRQILYERQAWRFLNGDIPTIWSASLRGPFDKESGWRNPWRSRRACPPKATAPAKKLDGQPSKISIGIDNRRPLEAHDTSEVDDQDGVKELSQVHVAMRHCNADTAATQDTSLFVLPRSLASQSSTSISNRYMSDIDLTRVATWRDTVNLNVAAREDFWAPEQRDDRGVESVKRSRHTEWLRRKVTKRRKTGATDSFMYDSPIQTILQKRPRRQSGPESAPSFTSLEAQMAGDVTVMSHCPSQIQGQYCDAGAPESSRRRLPRRESRSTNAVTDHVAQSNLLLGTPVDSNSLEGTNSSQKRRKTASPSHERSKSSNRLLSSSIRRAEKLQTISPRTENVRTTESRTSQGLQEATGACYLVDEEEKGSLDDISPGVYDEGTSAGLSQHGEQRRNTDGSKDFESQEDRSFYYRAKPKVKKSSRRRTSSREPDKEVQDDHMADKTGAAPESGPEGVNPSEAGSHKGPTVEHLENEEPREAVDKTSRRTSRDHSSEAAGVIQEGAFGGGASYDALNLENELPTPVESPANMAEEAHEADAKEGRSKMDLSSSGAESRSLRIRCTAPLEITPRDMVHTTDTRRDAVCESDVQEKEGSPDADILPIQIPMSQEEWGLGLYKVIAEHFDLDIGSGREDVTEATKQPQLPIPTVREALESPNHELRAPGEDDLELSPSVPVSPANGTANHAVGTTEYDGTTVNISITEYASSRPEEAKGSSPVPIAEKDANSIDMTDDTTMDITEANSALCRSSSTEVKAADPTPGKEIHLPEAEVECAEHCDTTVDINPDQRQSSVTGEPHNIYPPTVAEEASKNTVDHTAAIADTDGATVSISPDQEQSPWTREEKTLGTGPLMAQLRPSRSTEAIIEGPSARKAHSIPLSQQSPWNEKEPEPSLPRHQSLTPRSERAMELSSHSPPRPTIHDASGGKEVPISSSQIPPSTPETKLSGLPTPDFSLSIKSFAKFMTPSSPRHRRSQRVSLTDSHLPSTQALVGAALSNPWTKSSSKKSGRRVSFAPLPGERTGGGSEEANKENEDLTMEFSVEPRGLQFSGKDDGEGSRARAASPPIALPLANLPDHDGKFSSHFAAAAKGKARPRRRPRLGRRLLPSASQQVASSPSVGAMAEAFIEAEKPAEQPAANCDEEEPGSWQGDGDTKDEPVDDVSAVIHNLSDFLDSWDVDDELAKARSSSGGQGGARPSTGLMSF